MPDHQQAPKPKRTPTPGPWGWYETADGYAVEGHGNPSGTVALVVARKSATGISDARLIAASPEMYEALREMLAAHSMEGVYGADQSDIGGMKRRTAAKAAARAALAKAEGR